MNVEPERRLAISSHLEGEVSIVSNFIFFSIFLERDFLSLLRGNPQRKAEQMAISKVIVDEEKLVRWSLRAKEIGSRTEELYWRLPFLSLYFLHLCESISYIFIASDLKKCLMFWKIVLKTFVCCIHENSPSFLQRNREILCILMKI